MMSDDPQALRSNVVTTNSNDTSGPSSRSSNHLKRNEAVKIPESELPQRQRQYWIHDDHKIHTLLFVCTQTVPLLQILEKFP